MRSLHITDKIKIIENGLSAKQTGFTHTRRCKPTQTQDSGLNYVPLYNYILVFYQSKQLMGAANRRFL